MKLTFNIKKTIYSIDQIKVLPSLHGRRSCEVPQKFVPDRFSRFDVNWIQTNRKTNKQSSI